MYCNSFINFEATLMIFFEKIDDFITKFADVRNNYLFFIYLLPFAV